MIDNIVRFQVRVGSSHCEAETQRVQWSDVRGTHGVSNVNEAGVTLLTFCTLNGSTMNTWQVVGSGTVLITF